MVWGFLKYGEAMPAGHCVVMQCSLEYGYRIALISPDEHKLIGRGYRDQGRLWKCLEDEAQGMKGIVRSVESLLYSYKTIRPAADPVVGVLAKTRMAAQLLDEAAKELGAMVLDIETSLLILAEARKCEGW